MMNIFCIYWQGVFRGRDFSTHDIIRLYESVKKNIDRSFTFYCLTNWRWLDLPPQIKIISLKHNWPGWWAKVELHRPDLPKGRTLYLDLDTHIVGSLQPILDFPGNLVMFNTPHKKPAPNIVRRYQAATMLFDSGTPVMVGLYNRFRMDCEHLMDKYRSEQDVMGDWIPNQPTFPNEWMMKLNDCKNMKNLPKECIIVTGQPKDISFRDTEKIAWLNQTVEI